MPHRAPHRRAMRPALALLAVVALLGACGGDDSDAADRTTTTDDVEETTTTEAEETTTTEATDDGGSGGDTGDVCEILDPADLSAATGETFGEGSGSERACTYTSEEGSAIAVNVADVTGAPAEAALDGASSTCDEGTVTDLTFEGADGAFSCQVSGIATVAAVGEGALVVLTGAATDPSLDAEAIIGALTQILEKSIADGSNLT